MQQVWCLSWEEMWCQSPIFQWKWKVQLKETVTWTREMLHVEWPEIPLTSQRGTKWYTYTIIDKSTRHKHIWKCYIVSFIVNNKNVHMIYIFLFFNCYFAAPQLTLGHSQGASLTNLMLINVFFSVSAWRSPRAL